MDFLNEPTANLQASSEDELCLVCDKPVPGFKYEYCCSSFDCGCGGFPTEPCICSQECWDLFFKRGKNNEL